MFINAPMIFPMISPKPAAISPAWLNMSVSPLMFPSALEAQPPVSSLIQSVNLLINGSAAARSASMRRVRFPRIIPVLDRT